MATVYQRLQANIKLRPTVFMLSPEHRNRLGRLIAKTFRETPSSEQTDIELVTSIEGKESFTVANYPESFTPVIDEQIGMYYKALFVQIKARKEKNKVKVPEKKLRARKPLKKAVFPVWKGSAKK